MRVTGLKTEQLDAPLGLELAHPRLSWRLESDRPGAAQSAYRVRVAASPGVLAAGGADLWDSGQVASGATFDIAYAGAPLEARQRCWWTVEVWDEAGAPADPAPVATWEMSLLDPADWAAKWLAVETEEDRADRDAGLRWIWSDDDPQADPRRFRLTFRLDAPAEATLIVGARGRIDVLDLDAGPLEREPPNPHAFGAQGVQQLQLGELASGEHTLLAEIAATPNPRDPRPFEGAFAALLKLRGRDGDLQRIVTGADWQTSAGGEAWTAAASAAHPPRAGWPATGAMLLRRDFEVESPVASARLYATALGAYEAFLNGERVGDALLAPESTDFRLRVLYRVFDVTERVRAGANVLAAHVGDGWYASYVAPGGRYAFGPAPRRFLAQLELSFADGRRQVVATGDGWRISPSPVLASEIYNGETHDARREQPGWSAPGFDDAEWTDARIETGPPGKLTAHAAPPIRVTGKLTARSIGEPKPGVFVFDFGQNFAGLPRLRVKGRAGETVTLRFAEILLPTGEVDQSNLRAAKATDTYVLKGDPAGEIWSPAFTYHGFRYVQVEGYPGTPTAADLEGLVIHSDLPVTGALRIDSPLIEQVWKNAVWSQRSNFTGIPTDCPQRDERLGWLGDANVFWDAAAFNMDVYGFTQRFSGDMRDAQTPNGAFSDYAPAARRAIDQPAPGWADAGVALPWTAWRRYGATSIIDANWDAMARYLRYLEESNPDALWRRNRGLDFGDWLALDARQPGDPTTPKDLVGSAWWARTTEMGHEMAVATGRTDDAAWLDDLHGRIMEAFRAAYVGADGRVGNGSQTGYILALKFGLVPAALRAAAGEHLVGEIEGRGGVLSTGFLGTPFALDVLADLGRADLVYDLLLRTEFPSWGYMIAKGATTIWERWNGDTGDVAMNSFNHYAFGAVGGFLFRRVAGIAPAAAGFREIDVAPILDPGPDPRVRKAGADYDSAVGRISTDWTWTPGGSFKLALTVPANAVAHVALPAHPGREAQLDGAAPDGLQRTGEALAFDVGPGVHNIRV